MKKHLCIVRGLLFCLFAVSLLPVWAGRIDEEEALRKAVAFMQKQSTSSRMAKMSRVPAQFVAAATADGDQPIYIFNRDGGGYVVVSGDDRTFDILGYSYTGKIDVDNMPANMRAWLENYSVAISNLPDDVVPCRSEAQDVKPSIEPCLKTEWNQGEPFNRTAPLLYYTEDEVDKCERAVTGCSSTALAQVMYYYRYPDAVLVNLEGYDDKAYINGDEVPYSVAAVEAGTPIEWEKMLTSYDTYNKNYTEEQADAVARLMQYIGTACHSMYGLSTATSITKEVECMYMFGYKDAHLVSREDYGDYQEWVNRVYEEIKAVGVVPFGGSTSSGGGHSFVIDGYENDCFHVNWGWGGYCDGYFRLDVMNPYESSESQNKWYSEGQTFIGGLGPKGEGAIKAKGLFECAGFRFGEEGQTYAIDGDNNIVSSFELYISNYSIPHFSAYVAFAVYAYNGTLISVNRCFGTEPIGIDLYNSVGGGGNCFITVPSLDGIYKVVPVCAAVNPDETGEISWEPMLKSENHTVYLNVKNGQATVSYIAPEEPSAISLTVSEEAGWATLYTPYCALDFSSLKGSLTAYVATVDGECVKLTSVDDIPANTGVVLRGAGSYEIPIIADAKNQTQGELTGSAFPTNYDGDALYINYVLTRGDDAMQFNPVISGTIAAGKAYLQLPKSAGASLRVVVVDSEVTSVSDIEVADEGNAMLYNVVGQPVNGSYKGIVIKNGKKYLNR